ncbi:MAG: nitrate reductase associated protein [Leptodesmis sp.]|uniref:nitrate reductase associated protein n=1 Tax=Leptodesmis sp. TaxID=3100501 RepID=UPI003D107412
MPNFFQFESDFVESLRCIPMQVRLKLDTCGIKLKLQQWNQFTQDDRLKLVELPCETESEIQAYRKFLCKLVQQRTGAIASELAIDPQPPWLDATTIPQDASTKAAAVEVNLTLEQWASLTPLQRFALLKLSRSGHENHNFVPALREFQLI